MTTKIKTYAPLEKILAVAGFALVVLGCVASLYYGFTNQRFIHDLGFVYYFNYFILLSGGFLAGYLSVFRPGKRAGSRELFSGTVYAFLAMALYWLFDMIRLLIQGIGILPFPWEKILFEGAPLFALIATVLIAFLTQYRQKRHTLSMGAKWSFGVSLVIAQAYFLVSGLYALAANSAHYDSGITPIWLVVVNILLNPLVVAAVAFALLSNIKNVFDRAFYALFVGGFAGFLMLILWLFQTDPMIEAVTAFQSFATIVTLLATSLLLWRARSLAK